MDSDVNADKRYAIVFGTVADGFTHVGPFDSIEDACFWADGDGYQYLDRQESSWDVVALENQESATR